MTDFHGPLTIYILTPMGSEELKLHLFLYCWKSTKHDHKEENHESLRVVYVLSEYIECIIDPALEVVSMEALS